MILGYMRRSIVAAGLASIVSTAAASALLTVPNHYRVSPGIEDLGLDMESFVEGDALLPYRSAKERAEYHSRARSLLDADLKAGMVEWLLGNYPPYFSIPFQVNDHTVEFIAQRPESSKNAVMLPAPRTFSVLQSVTGDEKYAHGLIVVNFMQRDDGRVLPLSIVVKKDGSSEPRELGMRDDFRSAMSAYIENLLNLYAFTQNREATPNDPDVKKMYTAAEQIFISPQMHLYNILQNANILSHSFSTSDD